MSVPIADEVQAFIKHPRDLLLLRPAIGAKAEARSPIGRAWSGGGEDLPTSAVYARKQLSSGFPCSRVRLTMPRHVIESIGSEF
jgi:hypothetical protein